MVDINHLKNKVQLQNIIAQQHQLKGNGRYLRGIEHNSLVIDTKKQTWARYSQGIGGDILDWLGHNKFNGTWDTKNKKMFVEVLADLAEIAGVPLDKKNYTPPPYQDIFNLAKSHYSQQLSLEFIEYCQNRGIELEIIKKASLGVGGNLKSKLAKKDYPHALKAGLLKKLDNGKIIDSIPIGYLVFTHHLHGQPRYFSSRSITEKKHYNLPGEKEPFILINDFKKLIIVEGQFDALSAYQLGYSAYGMCGVTYGKIDKDFINLFEHVYYIPDKDKAGQNSIKPLCTAIGNPLLNIVYLGVLSDLPEKADLNDLLKIDPDGELLTELLGKSRTFIYYLLNELTNLAYNERDNATEELFKLLGCLSKFALARYKNTVCTVLAISKADFNELLKAASLVNEITPTRYKYTGGYTCLVDRNNLQPLANAKIEIKHLRQRDNGDGEILSEYQLGGETEAGPLPLRTVPCADFNKMAWINEHYPRIVVEAGRATIDHLRAAIQRLSNFKTTTIFEHTGWRKIGKTQVYLTCSGPLGEENNQDDTNNAITTTVDLTAGRPETNLKRYQLPLNPENVAEAIKYSFEFWNITNYNATIPLWACMYLAPLNPILSTNFGLWVHGKSGSFKSVLSVLALAHFGDWSGREAHHHAPQSFLSTHTNILMDAYLCKDIPFLIDDFAPGNTQQENKERDLVASKLLRSLGNNAGRGRMKRDGRTYQANHPPRCLAIITAEDIPSGQSIMARGLAVRMITPPPNSAERKKIIAKITTAQDDHAPHYKHAMGAYILWVAKNWQHLQKTLPALANKYNNNAKSSHARLSDAYGKLMAAVSTALTFFVEEKAITKEMAEGNLTLAKTVLQDILTEHSQNIEDLDPVLIFCETIREMLDSYTWHILPMSDSELANVTSEPAFAGNRGDGDNEMYIHLLPKNSELIGYYDQFHIYLQTRVYSMVKRNYQNGGNVFPLGKSTLYNRLIESDVLEKTKNGASDTVFIPRIKTSPRMLKIKKSAIYPND